MEWESDTTDLGSTQSCETSRIDLNQAMLLSIDESFDDHERIKKDRAAELPREDNYSSDSKSWNSTKYYSYPSCRKQLEILGIKSLGCLGRGRGNFYLENAGNTENLDESQDVDYESTLSLGESSFRSTDFTNSNKESFDGTYDESFYETDSSYEKNLADRNQIRSNLIGEKLLLQSGSINRNCTYNLSKQQFVQGESSCCHTRYGNSLGASSYQNFTDQDLIPENSANWDTTDRRDFDSSVEKEFVRQNSFARQNSEKNFLSSGLLKKEGSTEQLSKCKKSPNRRLVYENESTVDDAIVTGNPTRRPIVVDPSTNENSLDSRMESLLRLANQSFPNIMSISGVENFETFGQLKILERSILEDNGPPDSSGKNSFENTSKRAFNEKENFKASSHATNVSRSSELGGDSYYDFEGLGEGSHSNLDSRNENLEDSGSNAGNENGNSDSDFISDTENQKFPYKSQYLNTNFLVDREKIVDHVLSSAYERKLENFGINSRLSRNTGFKPRSQAVPEQKNPDCAANVDVMAKLHARVQKLNKAQSNSKEAQSNSEENKNSSPRLSGISSMDNNFGRIFKSKSLSPSNFPVESKTGDHRGILRWNNAESRGNRRPLLGMDGGEGFKFRSSSVHGLNQVSNFGQHSVPNRKYFSDTESDNFNIVTTAINSLHADTGTVTMNTCATATNTNAVTSMLATTSTKKNSPNARIDNNNINKIAGHATVDNSSNNKKITLGSSRANFKDSKPTMGLTNLINPEENSYAKSSKSTAKNQNEDQKPNEKTPLKVIIRRMLDERMGESSKRPEIPAVIIEDLSPNSKNPHFLETESGNISKTQPAPPRSNWIDSREEFQDRLDLFGSLLSSANNELDSWRRLTTVLETDESRFNSRTREVSDWSRSSREHESLSTDSDSYELSGECLIEIPTETSETSDNF